MFIRATSMRSASVVSVRRISVRDSREWSACSHPYFANCSNSAFLLLEWLETNSKCNGMKCEMRITTREFRQESFVLCVWWGNYVKWSVQIVYNATTLISVSQMKDLSLKRMNGIRCRQSPSESLKVCVWWQKRHYYYQLIQWISIASLR